MNRKLKTIIAALLAAAMCASFAGCANNETSDVGKNESSKTQSSKQSSTESKPESDDTSDSTSKPEEPAAKLPDITPAATDEILNAPLDAGKVQWYNDVFQCGGFVTVKEFVDKYKSKYDINYDGEPVTDKTLSSLVEPSFENGVIEGKEPSLRVAPNFTVNGEELNKYTMRLAGFVNPTDKEIPLSECYISMVTLYDYPFFPSVLEEKLTDTPAFLEGLGYESIKVPTYDKSFVPSSIEFDKKYYKDYYGNYYFCEVGETNAFGAKPLYSYWVFSATNYGDMRGLMRVSYIFE